MPADALELLLNHDWPGNVRELRNAVQRTLTLGLVGLGTGTVDLTADPPPDAMGGELVRSTELSDPEPYRDAREKAMRDFEIKYLTNLWAYTSGNLSSASRIAGIDRKYIRSLLKKYSLND